jgi:hypothetical protein
VGKANQPEKSRYGSAKSGPVMLSISRVHSK